MSVPLAEFNAFHGIGLVFFAWAMVVAFLGSRRTEFPGNQGAQRAVVAISAILFAATVGAAIATSEKHGAHESSHGDRENPTHQGETPENVPDE